MNTEHIGYLATAVVLASAWIWIAINVENAPLYDEDKDKFNYKKYFTIFGIKIKKNKTK